jgi:hypothetical protein
MSESTISILRGVRELVGDEEFKMAVASLDSDSPVEVTKKEKKPRKSDPVKTAIRTAEMAALAAFTKHTRGTMPEGTPYKEVQAAAGSAWKAMTAEAKTAWKAAHMPAETSDKECVVTAVTPEVKQTVVAVKEGEKKGRGRPKKEVADSE